MSMHKTPKSHKKIKLDNPMTAKSITFHCSIKNDYEMKVREEMFDSGDNSDVEFLVGDKSDVKSFKAHRLILITGSKKFKNLLEGKKNENLIVLPDITPENFEMLLRAIYIHRFDLRSFRAAAAYAKLFEEYGLKSAAEQCLKYLHSRDNLTEETSISIYETTETSLNNSEISQECLNLFRTHTLQVLGSESFYRATLPTVVKIFEQPELNIRSEMDLVAALFTYAQAQNALPLQNPDRFIDYVRPALCCIRFYTCNVAELLTSEKAKALLSSDELLAIVANILVPQNSLYEYPKYFSISIVRRAMGDEESINSGTCTKNVTTSFYRETTSLWDVTALAQRVNPTPSKSMEESVKETGAPLGNSTRDSENLVKDDESIWEPITPLEMPVVNDETPLSLAANDSLKNAPTKKFLNNHNKSPAGNSFANKNNANDKTNDELWDV